MNLKEIRIVNEAYHKADKVQKRVITSKNFTYRTLTDVLDKYVKENSEIVDLGCGVGTLDFYLASNGCNVTGIDDSEIAVQMAKKNAEVLGLTKRVKYIRKNIFGFKTNKKYDAVLLFEVIEHLPFDEKAIKLTKGLLRKNGYLFVSTRSSNAPLTRLGVTKKHDENVGHLRRYTLQGLGKMIRGEDLKVVVSKKTEGLLKELLFSYPKLGSPFIRLANRFSIISDILHFFDTLSMRLFGESQLIIVAKKK